MGARWIVRGLAALWGLAAFASCSPEVPSPPLTFERFHTTDEIRARFRALAERHPRWFETGSLGSTVQGREIPFLRVTDQRAPGEKRGFWIDGAIHGMELASCEPALGLVERLAVRIEAGEEPAVLRRVVLHVVPVVNPDARHVAITPPGLRQRKNLAPVDDDKDGLFDEDGPADVSGDGRIAMMRIADGSERGGYRYEAKDQDGDGQCGEDPPGGVDLNRNFPVPREPGDVEGGPLQPETAAVMAYWEAHPDIELAVSYHTSANIYVLPPVPLEDDELARFDRYLDLYREAVDLDEYSLSPAQLRGLSVEWFWRARGAVAFIVEINVDGEDTERPVRRMKHPCYGTVEIPFIGDGWMFQNMERLERDLAQVVDLHATVLLDVADELAAHP